MPVELHLPELYLKGTGRKGGRGGRDGREDGEEVVLFTDMT